MLSESQCIWPTWHFVSCQWPLLQTLESIARLTVHLHSSTGFCFFVFQMNETGSKILNCWENSIHENRHPIVPSLAELDPCLFSWNTANVFCFVFLINNKPVMQAKDPNGLKSWVKLSEGLLLPPPAQFAQECWTSAKPHRSLCKSCAVQSRDHRRRCLSRRCPGGRMQTYEKLFQEFPVEGLSGMS